MATESRKDSTKRSVYLVMDLPGMASERVSDLEEAMKTFASKWIEKDTTHYYNDHYVINVGVTETKKLRIFVQER